jgi:hypothetical protein
MQQAEVIQNHDNENVRNIGQGEAWSSTIFQLIIYTFNCITYPLLTGMVLSNFIITASTHFLFKIKHWTKKSQEDIFTLLKFCKMPIVTTQNI